MKIYLKHLIIFYCMNISELLVYTGLTLILLGIALTIIALILFMFRGTGKTEKARGGGIILIGPFPIIFGTSHESLKTLLLVTIILVAVTLAFIIAFNHLNLM